MLKVLLSSIRCFLGRSINGNNKSLNWLMPIKCDAEQLLHKWIDAANKGSQKESN